MSKKSSLDQFYTKEEVSIKCCKILKKKLGNTLNFSKEKFFEPSAGTGAFISAAKKVFGKDISIKAYDIEPKSQEIKYANFLTLEVPQKEEYITIGNPPFGKRSKLAIDFFNKAATFSHTIAFIIPLQFEKYSVQKNLNKDFRLIHSEILDPDSFICNGKTYKVRCCFQIWTKLKTKHKDKRITSSPDIQHPDFQLFQYNNTEQSIKYFNKTEYKWDFAIPRQGFYDYNLRIENPEDLKKNVQYIFFKAKNEEIKQRLLSIDYNKLSQKNTTIPGFGKADVIQCYKEMLANE